MLVAEKSMATDMRSANAMVLNLINAPFQRWTGKGLKRLLPFLAGEGIGPSPAVACLMDR